MLVCFFPRVFWHSDMQGFFLQFRSEGNELRCATGVLQILLSRSLLLSQCYKTTLSILFQATRMFFSVAAHLLPCSLC